MNKEQIVEKIKETEEQLAKLRADLEKPEYSTLAEAKTGDMLENFCVVVHKFSDVRMALIAAPKHTEVPCQWSKEFSNVFKCLAFLGFNRSQWFIPTVEQLNLAYKNCREHFSAPIYWSSDEVSSKISYRVGFITGKRIPINKPFAYHVRAFSLVSY
jgi:hypothetical protein